ncbi:unnamed protein product [Rotaria sordida]|uniref:FLYWCH-type domain-containing protein n=2 Tax=Rotaria sordida TaxID=392033 RepID=A0A819VYY9_9BILA|nr:unnamed protein product [Rotaria sordida]
MNQDAENSTNNNTTNRLGINDMDVHTLANAIALAMRMNGGNQIKQRERTTEDIASAVVMALSTTTKTTNTLPPPSTTTSTPFRACSTMRSTDDSLDSPFLSPIKEQSPKLRNMQQKNNYVPIAPPRRSQNSPVLLALPSKPNINDQIAAGGLLTNSTPLIQWSFTSKGKDLLIVNNHSFKCNKTTNAKHYWRCDQGDYCNVWVQTTLDGNYLDMSKSEHNHFCDPDRIVINKLIGIIRQRCKIELLSIATIYEQEVKKAKLTPAQLCRMPRYDQLRKLSIFSVRFPLLLSRNTSDLESAPECKHKQ